MWKNNLRIKGLEEEAEGHCLQTFLEDLFTGCLRSDSNIMVKVVFDFRIGYQGKKKEKPRDDLVGLAY